jgi:hypothetical protein
VVTWWCTVTAANLERRTVRLVIAAAAAVMLLLLTGGRPWTLFSEGAFSSDFYDAQAMSLTDGRLAVDPAVASIEGFEVGDDTHIYYGILLAVARVPLFLVTDWFAGRLTAPSILAAYVITLLAGARLARACRGFVRGHGAAHSDTPQGADRWRIAVFLLGLGASPALFAGGWLTIYHETEIWALAFAIIALAFAVEVYARPSLHPATIAGAAAAAALTTRVSVGVGVGAGVVVALVLAPWPRRRQLAAPLGVIAVGALGHMGVNWARFGSLLSVPFQDQRLSQIQPERAEWLAANGDSFFSASFIPATLVHYVRPDAIGLERLVPFIRYGRMAEAWGDLPFESNTPSSSLTVTATLLCLLAIAGAVWLLRNRQWALVAVVAAVALAAVPTLAIGFVANRYLIDLLAPLALLAAFGSWYGIRRRQAAVATVAALTAWGVVVNVSLALWTGHYTEPGFTRARYSADKIFPAPSPGLIRVDDVSGIPRFGTVGVDLAAGECRGVYIATEDAWHRLEQPHGHRRVSGSVEMGDVDLVETPHWVLSLQPDGVVTIESDGATTQLLDIDAEAGELISYQVVADPVVGQRFVQIDGATAYLPADVLEHDGPLDAGNREAGELCPLLTDRLG